MTADQRTLLLDLAADSIEYGLHRDEPFPVKLDAFPPPLTVKRATFVTLTREGELRGCIGTLYAARPLVQDVARHAFEAAFRDPRFPPVSWTELDAMEISISVLTPTEPMRAASEADLLVQLRPGVDGLVLEEGFRHATFLPAVWETLPTPREFVEALKQKAGWPRGYWSDRMTAYRYTVQEIP